MGSTIYLSTEPGHLRVVCTDRSMLNGNAKMQPAGLLSNVGHATECDQPPIVLKNDGNQNAKFLITLRP